MRTQMEILRAALFTPAGRGRWGLPMMLWGEPGVAKTAIVEEIGANYADMPTITLSPGERGEGAFGVVPVPGYSDASLARILEKTKDMPPALAEAFMRLAPPDMLNYPRPDWSGMFDQTQRGIVFIDEIPNAPPAIQPPLYGLVLNGTIGGHQLPGGVRRIGAGNPPEKCGIGYPTPPALANRFGHLEWTGPSVSDHVAYMLRGDLDDESTASSSAAKEEARVMKLWPEAFAKARGLETAYLQRRPVHKNQFPKDNAAAAARAWASDRSWTNATRAYGASLVHGLSDEAREEFVSSFIGHGVASEFMAWIEESDLPDPVDVLDGKEKFKHDDKRPDRTVAILNGCVATIMPTNAENRKPRNVALWTLLRNLLEKRCDKDIIVPAVRSLVNGKLQIGVKESDYALEELHEIVKATAYQQGGEEL